MNTPPHDFFGPKVLPFDQLWKYAFAELFLNNEHIFWH